MSAAARVTRFFSVASWNPLDPAGVQMLTESAEDLSLPPPRPSLLSSFWKTHRGESHIWGSRLVELSRAWVGPKQVHSSEPADR